MDLVTKIFRLLLKKDMLVLKRSRNSLLQLVLKSRDYLLSLPNNNSPLKWSLTIKII
jgi:hypothetical protein